jgi:hypothetical protein
MALRTNAPRMVTVVLAIGLTLAGLSATVLPMGFVDEVLSGMGFELTRDQAWWCLLASPALLIAGSLLANL